MSDRDDDDIPLLDMMARAASMGTTEKTAPGEQTKQMDSAVSAAKQTTSPGAENQQQTSAENGILEERPSVSTASPPKYQGSDDRAVTEETTANTQQLKPAEEKSKPDVSMQPAHVPNANSDVGAGQGEDTGQNKAGDMDVDPTDTGADGEAKAEEATGRGAKNKRTAIQTAVPAEGSKRPRREAATRSNSLKNLDSTAQPTRTRGKRATYVGQDDSESAGEEEQNETKEEKEDKEKEEKPKATTTKVTRQPSARSRGGQKQEEPSSETKKKEAPARQQGSRGGKAGRGRGRSAAKPTTPAAADDESDSKEEDASSSSEEEEQTQAKKRKRAAAQRTTPTANARRPARSVLMPASDDNEDQENQGYPPPAEQQTAAASRRSRHGKQVNEVGYPDVESPEFEQLPVASKCAAMLKQLEEYNNHTTAMLQAAKKMLAHVSHWFNIEFTDASFGRTQVSDGTSKSVPQWIKGASKELAPSPELAKVTEQLKQAAGDCRLLFNVWKHMSENHLTGCAADHRQAVEQQQQQQQQQPSQPASRIPSLPTAPSKQSSLQAGKQPSLPDTSAKQQQQAHASNVTTLSKPKQSKPHANDNAGAQQRDASEKHIKQEPLQESIRQASSPKAGTPHKASKVHQPEDNNDQRQPPNDAQAGQPHTKGSLLYQDGRTVVVNGFTSRNDAERDAGVCLLANCLMPQRQHALDPLSVALQLEQEIYNRSDGYKGRGTIQEAYGKHLHVLWALLSETPPEVLEEHKPANGSTNLAELSLDLQRQLLNGEMPHDQLLDVVHELVTKQPSTASAAKNKG